jgi:outer membrane protein assembly factor BamA
MRYGTLAVLLLNLFFIQANAQKSESVRIVITDSLQHLNKKEGLIISTNKNIHETALEKTKVLQQQLFKLNENGYLSASLDSLHQDSLVTTAFIHIGPQYKWAYLKGGNVGEEVLNLIGYREKLYRDHPFSLREVRRLQEKVLNHYENTGYPFASIKLDSIEIIENKFHAVLAVTKNKMIKIDSIIIRGNAKITPVYLFSYLSIKPGSIYNEALIGKISTRLKELPFLKEIKPLNVVFTEKETKLILYLEDKKANQFDGIIGFLPKSDNSSQLVITGEAKLKLLSSFGRGEQIDLNWRKIGLNTQDLKARFAYPFLFSSPFGIEMNLTLYKKDTLFVDLFRSAGIQYLMQGGNYLKLFINNKQSTLLSTFGLERVNALPPYADVSATMYGLGIKQEKVDYRLNPRKGFSLEANASTGNKTITKQNKIPDYLYQNVQLNVTQYTIDYGVETYLPISDRMVLNTGFKGAHLISQSIFQNELYRFGGIKTLRGFDEESIFASSYSILKVEYRYILETNAYLFGFWNGAFYQNRSIGKSITDRPYGFGTGITFETKLGIFSVTYALGKQFDNPIYFKSGKIHFGIVNYF